MKIYGFGKKLIREVSVRYVLYAALTVLFAEILHTGFFSGITYFFRHPVAFVSAVLTVCLTYCISLLVKKRIGTFILIELCWIGVAVANCILLTYRINPLSAVDFSIIFSVFSIIGIYLSPIQIVLVVSAILLALALVVFLMIRLPGEKVDYKRSVIRIVSIGVLTFGVFFFGAFGYADGIKGLNLPQVYSEYGFVYSFSLSFVDRGISRPDDYSRVDIDSIISKDEQTDTGTSDGGASDDPSADNTETDIVSGEPVEKATVNVIFVQLESFFDPAQIIGLHTSENAVPNFTWLRENYPSGSLTVPVAGAGTVNTEFEVLCGLPISVFGLGEYPYETYVKNNPCEALPYYLRDEGYTSHALHNHTGTFYNRYSVMKNFGFDTFTPIEYMMDTDKNILGWAEDAVLTDEIMGALNSTEGADFVYAISVQAHGKYPGVPDDYGNIHVFGDFNEDVLNGIDYYVNQIYDTDRFVGELISRLDALEEDTVAVFFGDHQPSIDVTSDGLVCGSVYTTEYVIWNNIGLEVKKEDKCSYELSSYVLDTLGISGGVITKLHTMNEETPSLDDFTTLAYDILFGERYAYGGSFPYTVSEMKFGWRDVSVKNAFIKNDVLYVYGENFTESSKILTDGKKRETYYVSGELIMTPNVAEASSVTVAQIAENGFVFGEITAELYTGADFDFEINISEEK
ncbi:MAG: LTA synthase family protein [Clostridia bacterium]|nr:LTA synthase family protein [Clostridia bacterium]